MSSELISGLRLRCRTCGDVSVKTQNPTHGSGWIVQIPRLRMLRVRGKRAGLELSTHCRGWDFRRIDHYSFGRLNLKLSTHCRGWDYKFFPTQSLCPPEKLLFMPRA